VWGAGHIGVQKTVCPVRVACRIMDGKWKVGFKKLGHEDQQHNHRTTDISVLQEGQVQQAARQRKPGGIPLCTPALVRIFAAFIFRCRLYCLVFSSGISFSDTSGGGE